MHGKRSIAALLVFVLMTVIFFSITTTAYAVNWGRVAVKAGAN